MDSCHAISEICHSVQARLRGQLRNFEVLVDRDGLILKGRTGTFYAKQLAQHAVMKASGLPILANEIEVA